MRTSRSTLLGMKPSSSKEYISFGVPDFESPHKSGNLLRNFIAKLTGANSNNQQNSKCKFQLPEVQESANIETECHEVSDLSHPIPNVNISQETSVFSSGQLSEPIRQSERRYWMQDENCKFCFECGSRFTAIRRKHHCRVCGRIFCNQCSNQFVEGTQIGLDGLQRACSYCAEVLITTDTKKPEYSLSKHAMQSLNADNAYALKKKVSEIGHNGKNNMSDSIPSQISRLSSRNVHVNTSLNTISNGKGVLNSTLRFRRQTLDSFNPCHSTSNNSTDESPDLFPTYVPTTFANASFSAVISSPPNSTEKVKHHSMGTSAFHLIHRTPCKNKTLIVDDSINTNVPSTPFKKISLSHSFECLLSCTSPSLFNSSSDQEMLLLWSRIWANSSEDSSFPITITSKLNAVSTESSSLIHSHSNENVTKENSSSKLLQLFKWKRDNEEVYCVYGLVLVYWLVNNIPGLKHCRMKGRIVCQKFMDLGLLTDLQDPNSREFHDDFTFYRLKQINSDSRSNHQTSSRRKTMDSISCDNDWFRVNSNTYPSTFGIDEPDWLLEINGRENKNSGSSTPFLLESFNDDTSKPSTVSYNDNILSNFEVGQDVSRMREYSSEGHKSPKKRQYVSQPIATTNQESSVSIQPDSTVQLSKHKNIYNMKAAFDEHIYQLVLQDIRDNALHPSWVSILIRLAWKVCQTVGFDLRSTGMRYFQFNRQQQQQLPTSGVVNSSTAHNNAANPNASHRQKVYSSMDIRYYVHIKKLLDKDNNSSDVFPGTIFSKHPTHKLMPSVLNNPRILLLDSSISYQRTTSKMAWLESQIMQEEEYITNCVCKILCLHPNIIFISGTVCHLAQNFIFKSGIILFSNVKQSVLYRIARMTGADILDSVDRLLSNPTRKSDNNCQKPTTRLGVCNRFEVRQIHLSDNSTKFLTFIENNLSESGIAPNASGNNNTSANPIRFITHEATVILRGDDIASIIRAKRCFLFALRLCYNAQLELAYSNNDHILHLPDLSIIQGTNSRTRVHSFHKMCMENNVSNNNTLVSSPVVRKKALTLPGSVLSTSATMHEQIIAPNDEANESAYSDLAIYLRGRILSISPCIEFRLPYLASKEGQLSYLYAYYTYVIDWPLGRKLNDLMKRKIKVIHSEMKALEYYRINVKSDNSFSEQIVNSKSHHPFTKRNLEISSSSNVYDAKSNCHVPYSHDDSINNNYALDGLVITETLTSSDEALYTDYKARAFMISVGKKNGETCRSFPRLWGSIGSILSGHWDLLFNTEKLKSFKSKFAGFHSTTTGFTHNSNIQVHSENESIKRLRRSILDPRSYQSLSFLAVLFTPKCILRPEPCVPPLIATIEFYGQNDLPLGLFLEKFCFMQQHCRNPLCNVPMSEHIQRFIQTSGSVQLTISKSIHDISQSEVLGDSPMICGNGDFKSRPKSRIQMWLFCPICRTNSAIRYMSADTWHLSFVKFLDLILNSSNDWARCDMLSKNSSNWRSTSGNEYDVVEKQKESSHSVGTDIANNHIIDPILEFNCPHSVHKSLEHCFSFDQKLATFKYQSINVYEIVMPPSEIRIFPIKTNPMKSDSNHISTTKKPPTGGKLNKNDNEFSDHCGGEDKPGQFHNQSNSSSLASRVTNIRKTPHLPSYLLTEATEVLTKYYTIHTVIKCHIANLQNETISCELSAMLEAYLKVLEADSSRILMDERSEFLNFLLYPNDDCQVDEKSVKKQNEYTANTPESVLHSVDSINQSPVIRPKSNLLVNEGNNEHISKLTEETFDSPLNQNDSLVTSDIDHMITCRQVTQRNVRNHTNSVSSSLNHSGEITTIHDVAENETRFQDWSKMTCGLNHVEIAYIVQRLVNELKRWIYRFVSDWNFRFNEYELLMKRIEKIFVTLEKKLPYLILLQRLQLHPVNRQLLRLVTQLLLKYRLHQ
ncbi:unnamed protein product [Heterobilharzia americana]|nr:unnamed protein product [Heterobilharzia americana]